MTEHSIANSSPPKRIIFNGKFLSAGPTGVHRVAEELVRRVQQRVLTDADLQKAISVELWVPSDGVERAAAAGLPAREVGPFTGVAWEQITLPARAGGDFVVSLCNVGPILSTSAMTMFHDAQVRISPDSYSPAFRLWYAVHQGITGKRHKRILTVSHFSREKIDSFGIAPAERIGVIHNGVDHFATLQADPTILDRLDLTAKPFVVALANTQVHKNIGVLLEAFADPRLRKVRLVLFGAARREDFEALGHRVGDNVVFAGRISDGELCALYRQARCIAFPSLTEGFGLPPLEAMSVGCPAVVAPMGALPEVCGDAGIYVDPMNADAWAEQIASLVPDDDRRAAIIATGLQHAATFTWDAAASSLLAEILALVEAENEVGTQSHPGLPA